MKLKSIYFRLCRRFFSIIFIFLFFSALSLNFVAMIYSNTLSTIILGNQYHWTDSLQLLIPATTTTTKNKEQNNKNNLKMPNWGHFFVAVLVIFHYYYFFALLFSTSHRVRSYHLLSLSLSFSFTIFFFIWEFKQTNKCLHNFILFYCVYRCLLHAFSLSLSQCRLQ